MTEVFKGKLSANTLTGDYVRVVTREQMALESAVVEAAVKWREFRDEMCDTSRFPTWDSQNEALKQEYYDAVDALIASRAETNAAWESFRLGLAVYRDRVDKGSSQDDLTSEDREP